MPDLRDLLNDAVDRPAPLDLDGLGRRVARHQRRHRLAMVTAAAVVMVLIGVAAASLAGRANGPDVDIDRVPPAGGGTTETVPGTGTTTPPSTSTSTSTSNVASGLPACTADDIDVAPGGEGATAQTAIYFEVSAAAGSQACSIDTTATVTLREIGTDRVLDIEGNPQTVALSGALGESQAGVEHEQLVLAGCEPGAAEDSRDELTVEVVIDGYGTYRGTTLGARCAAGGGGSFGPLTGPPD